MTPGLIPVRVALGVFFLFEGWDKLAWMFRPELLSTILQKWAIAGTPAARWYLETILIPAVPVAARLVFLGEVATGIAFLSGKAVRLAAILAFFMVLNIHVAHSTLFHVSFLSKGDGLPVLGGLVALMFAPRDRRVQLR